MKKSLKLFTVSLTVLAAVILLWQFSPTMNAQKSSAKKTIKPVVQSLPAEAADDSSIIYLNAGQLNAASAETQSLRQSVGGFSGKKMHLVKFDGAIQPEWYKSLTDSGLEIIDYIPNYTYLVYGDSTSLRKLQANARNAKSHIQWDAEYRDEYRISPDVYAKNGKDEKSETLSLRGDKYVVQLYKDESVNAETMSYIDTYRTEAVRNKTEISHYVNVTVGLSEEGLKQIAARPDVISIAPYLEPKKLDEVQDIILTGSLTAGIPVYQNYLTYLAGKGFTQAQFDASGFAVNVSDSGVDNGTQTPNHFGLYKAGNPASTSRVIYNRLEGTANTGSTIQGLDGHGNLNTHIVAGYVPDSLIGVSPHSDVNNYRYGMGVAPFVKVGSSVIFDPSNFTNPNYPNLESRAYRDGARISSNSWGASVSGAYNSDSQAYDFLVRDAQPATAAVPTAGNQEYTIVFSAGNSGAGAGTIGSPGTAKNVITVGAAENVRAFGGADLCGTTDADANNANDVIAFSSRGPTTDGRKKPDIMAPGTHVTGAVAQSSIASPAYSGTGSQIVGFTADGVCGGVSSNFFPSAGQQWYTASSGTSHSAPAISGIAALMRQHFINQAITPPTPAMTKALLSASARYMNGTGANDNLFSNNQGMGETSLNNFFDIVATPHVFRDELAADKFTATGQSRTITAAVSDNTKPVRVVLAWTDAPGTTTGNAFVNNLDLEVTVGGQTYLGNVFTNGNSVTGGTADAKDNLESVFLPAGVSGNMVVKVKGTNIAGDGVPNDTDLLDQDFSLIVSNAAAAALPVPSATAPAITAESISPANGTADPNETVTVNLPLANVGTANFTNLTATLQESSSQGIGGVLSPSSPQSYGALAANAAAVSKPFTFVANGTCGSTITLTFALSDGATSYGTVSYPLTLGTTTPTTISTQNFDAVTAPALPTGWTSTATGVESAWVTSTTTPNSAPNAAFAPDVTNIGNTELITPTINVPSGGGQVSFKNLFNLETGTTSGYDGMVLEISINGGAFADITANGNAFTSGGYTKTISASFSSPIAGRPAWSGLSGGTTAAPAYITSTINLPTAAAGQPIVLKWRVATDDSAVATGVAGARVDDVVVTGLTPVCATQACSLTPPANINTYAYDSPTGTVVNYPTATINGACGVVNYSKASGSVFPLGTTTVNITSTNLTSGENVPNAPTAATSFTVTVVPTTAAGAAVSGRVVSSTGRAVRSAIVTLTDSRGNIRQATTNAFGYFNFKEVPTGNTYVANVRAKGYQFSPMAFTLNDDAAGLVLVANP